MEEFKKDSVEATLCIPLWSRAMAARKFPDLMPDHDAAEILKKMNEKRPPTVLYYLESAAYAGAIRQYDLACEIKDYLKDHPEATIVELGAGLSCLRRQMGNEDNKWYNIDLEDVIRCREKYIETGDLERNIVHDLRDHTWFDKIEYEEEKGIIFVAAGVLHYFEYDEAKKLIMAMADHFKGGRFVFDYISAKGLKAGNYQVASTGNETRMKFVLNNAIKEISSWNKDIDVNIRSYMEGYPIKGMRLSFLTKAYIRTKRDKYFIAILDFGKDKNDE